MELKEIKKLLDKFYEGGTSLEEEHLLRNFFRNSDVPVDMAADKEFFNYLGVEHNKTPDNNNLLGKLHSILDKQVKNENKIRNFNLFYKISSIAAGIAIIVISYLVIINDNTKQMASDTYQDPKEAYDQVKRTLLYISQNLNHGTKTLHHVSKLEQGVMEFSTFSSFSSGLKDLELLGKYYNENEETK